MRNKLFCIGILTSLAFSMILTGCPDPGGSGTENPQPMLVADNQPISLLEINPSADALTLAASIMASMTVPKEYTGTGTVSLFFEDPAGKTQSIDVGAITAGKLSLTLPAEVDEALLPPLTMTEGVDVQPSGAKGLNPTFMVTENGAVKGILIFGTYTLSLGGVGVDSLQYMYFPQRTSIQGKGSSDASQLDNLTFTVTGKKGWNKLRVNSVFSGNVNDLTSGSASGTMTSDTTNLPADMRWWLIALGSSETPEPPTPPPPSSGTIADNAPVYESSSYPAGPYRGNAVVKLRLGEDIAVGAIDGGKLTITLPESIEDDLPQLSELFFNCTVTPPDARGIFLEFTLFDGNEEIGDLILEKTSFTMSSYRNDSVRYMYLPQAAEIAGAVQDESAGLEVKIQGSLGWNPIYMTMTSGGGMSTTVTSDLTHLPSGLTWTARLLEE